MIRSFRPRLDPGALRDLAARLATARLASTVSTDWDTGVPGPWLAELVDDWRAYDPAALQVRLDALHHARVDLDGIGVHLLHEVGEGPRPLPLLLTHGWPGSFCEYLGLLPLLTDPASHGGSEEDAFTVIVPSLPGFGFSDAPPRGGLPAPAVADLWHRLVVDELGYGRYVAHGSDLGAGVTAHLARRHPSTLAGIHLATPGLASAGDPVTGPEAGFAAEVEVWTAEEGGYAHEHATKPSTLGAALHDSPVGLAAWIGEKVRSWSSIGADGAPAFDRQLLLATLTLYWVTGTITSSLMPYWAHRHGTATGLPPDDPASTPTAVSIFGGERVPFPKPPRQLAERYFTVTSWEEHDRGGHFPAVSEPQLLAETLRAAFRPYRA